MVLIIHNIQAQKYFFVYDTAHILKCIRNNRLNQADKDIFSHDQEAQRCSKENYCYAATTRITIAVIAAVAAAFAAISTAAAVATSVTAVASNATVLRNARILLPALFTATKVSNSFYPQQSSLAQTQVFQHKASFSCLKIMCMDEKNFLVKCATKLTYVNIS